MFLMEDIRLNTQSISVITGFVKEYSLFEDSVMLFKLDERSVDIKIPLRADFGAIVCTEGEAELNINFKPHKVKKGTMVINSSRNVIQIVNSSPDYRGSVIIVSEAFTRKTIIDLREIATELLQIHLNPCINMQPIAYETFNKYYELIEFIIESNNSVSTNDSLRSLIVSLVYNLKDLFFEHNKIYNAENSRYHKIFNDFILLLSSSCVNEKRVAYYADKFHLTPKYFSAIIKQVSGQSASKWIDEYLLLEAQILLRTSTLSIQEIANRLEFANASFFSKYFKQHLNITPGQYRKDDLK